MNTGVEENLCHCGRKWKYMEVGGDGAIHEPLTIHGRHTCLGSTSELALNSIVKQNRNDKHPEWVAENAVVISDREFFITTFTGLSWKFWREEE
jgi:hypothetical protein